MIVLLKPFKLAKLLFVTVFFTALVSTAYAQTTGNEDATEALQIEIELLTAELARVEERIADQYSDRLEALEIERRAFDDLTTAAWWLGGILSIVVVAVSLLVGKSAIEIRRELKDDLKTEIENRVDMLVSKNTEGGEGLMKLVERATAARSNLADLEESFRKYGVLSEQLEEASDIDPAVLYYEVDREIDDRESKTKMMLQGDNSIAVEDTTRDPDFRRKVTLVFDRLLAAVDDDRTSGNQRFTSVFCFNASANASKMNLDFVSLKLMERAVEISNRIEPESQARMIRQKLNVTEYSPDKALADLRTVLEQTNGFDVHHVAAETFNIGLRLSRPVELADLCLEALPEPLTHVSYVQLNCGRLYRMGDSSAEWDKGAKLLKAGLKTLKSEAPTARWYEYSFQELAAIMLDEHDFVDNHRTELEAIFGIQESPQIFARKFGIPVTNALATLGHLHEFIKSPDFHPQN